MTGEHESIIVYGTTWCPDCKRSKQFLGEQRIHYHWVNGETFADHVEAAATLTLALPKLGLLAESAKSSVGALYLADISVPPRLYANLDLQVGPIFAQQEIIQLR